MSTLSEYQQGARGIFAEPASKPAAAKAAVHSTDVAVAEETLGLIGLNQR
jgi:hypothetical protein